MAKDDFNDIPDSGPAGAIPNIPMPPQQVIDQAVSGRQVTPEENATRPMRRGKKLQPQAQPIPREEGVRSIKDIIETFYAEISAHPDCVMLTSAMGGKPPREVFNDTPPMNRHMVELRFAWRDAMPETAQRMTQAAVGAYEPGGRYYNLIHATQETQQESQPNQTPAWDGMVKKREAASV